MKYVPLVFAGLWRKPARTIFTGLAIIVVFVLLGILASIDAGSAHLLEAARLDRMLVDSRFGAPMPSSYGARILTVPGVVAVSAVTGLGGYYQNRKNSAGMMLVEPSFFDIRPEVGASKQQIDNMTHTPDGAIVCATLARTYGWRIGEKVPIATKTAQRNGSQVWTFDIVSIIPDIDAPGGARCMFANYRYFDDLRSADKGLVRRFLVRINNPARSAATGHAIDKFFDNSSAPTRTSLEKADAQARVQEFGDISFLTRGVTGAVLFMLLFLTGNTMMQSVRERVREFGVLKTLGYSDLGLLTLVLSESLLLCAIAGGVGIAIVKIAFPFVQHAIVDFSLMPLLLPPLAAATGFGYVLLVAFLSAFLPALRMKKLNVVDALAGRWRG